ncbi:MAG: hypothetical protein HRF40_09100 [Nitrososphaera sp.]|jgi:hypothetical protein
MEKPLVLFTGIMRSGTSFLTRAFNLCGVYLGEYNELHSTTILPVDYNKGGTWESLKALELINKTPKKVRGLQSLPADLSDEITEFTHKLLNHPSLASGFKIHDIDALESWLPILKKCTNNIIIAATFRHPVRTAESIILNSKFKTYEEIFAFWCDSYDRLLELLNENPGFLFDFDWHKERLLAEINDAALRTGLVESDLSTWYKEEFKHKEVLFQGNPDDNVWNLYSRLQERSNHNKEVVIPQWNPSQGELRQIIRALLNQNMIQADLFNKQILSNNPDLIYSNVLKLAFKIMKWNARKKIRRK